MAVNCEWWRFDRPDRPCCSTRRQIFRPIFLFKFWAATATNLKKGFGRAGLGTGVGPGSATAVAISPASSRLRSIELLDYVASNCYAT